MQGPTTHPNARIRHPLTTPLLISTSFAALSFAETASADLIDSRTQADAWSFTDAPTSEQASADLTLHGQAAIKPLQSEHALSFTGDGHAQIAHNESLELQEGAIAIRFMPTGLGQTLETLFAKDSPGESEGDLSIILEQSDEDTDAVELTAQLTGDDGQLHTVTSAPLETSVWHEMQLAFGDEGMRLMIDAQLADANDHRGGIEKNRADIILGADPSDESIASLDILPGAYTGHIASLEVYGGEQVPSPGAALLLCMLGLAQPRRRHR